MKRAQSPQAARAVLPFGVPDLDRHIGGGLDMHRVHEVRPDARTREAAKIARLFTAAICSRTHAPTLWVHAGYWSSNLVKLVGFIESNSMVITSLSDEQALEIAAAAVACKRFRVIVLEMESLSQSASETLEKLQRYQRALIIVLRRRRGGVQVASAAMPFATRWAVGPGVNRLSDSGEDRRPRWRIRHLDAHRRVTLDVTTFGADPYGQISL